MVCDFLAATDPSRVEFQPEKLQACSAIQPPTPTSPPAQKWKVAGSRQQKNARVCAETFFLEFARVKAPPLFEPTQSV